MSGGAKSSTGLVDPVNGQPVYAHTDTGAYYVRKAGWPHFWGRALDALVVMAVAGAFMAILNSMVQSYALGALSTMLALSNGAFFAVLAAIWFVVVFAYGMIAGTAGSLGDAAARMRSVRLSDGTRSGALLGGWRAVCWSFAPLFCILVFTSALSGGGGDSFDAKFTALDVRSGVAGGGTPVPHLPTLSKPGLGSPNSGLPHL